MTTPESAKAGLITENLDAPFDGTVGEVGQSFTTGNDSQYNAISIGVYADYGNSATNPEAMGSLFLLNQEYLGSAQDLSSSSLGYVAQNQSISSGAWVFDNSVSLNGNTQYWFYTQGYTSITPAIGFASGGGPYAGGITYSGGNGTTNSYLRADVIDLGFSVNGSSVPEPSTLAVFGIGALGLVAGGIRRRKRSA